MLNHVKAIIFDFDGVINMNERNGEFRWQENLERDWGLAPADFNPKTFNRDFEAEVIPGNKKVAKHLIETIPERLNHENVEEFIAYWFSRDMHPDDEMLSLVQQVKDIGIDVHIGTNNEPRRAHQIWHEAGMVNYFHRFFTAGHIGKAKPFAGFYNHIEQALGLKGSDLLMVDDVEANVEGARTCGWHGHHFENIEGLQSALKLT